MLLPCVRLMSGLVCGEFELVRSLISLGLPQPNEPFFMTVVVGDSGVIGFTKSINGVSESSSESITIARLCLDGDLINRPSVPRGPVPLLLVPWLNVSMGFLISFLCIIFPFGVVTVWPLPDIAECGLSEYAFSNFFRWCFFSKNEKG